MCCLFYCLVLPLFEAPQKIKAITDVFETVEGVMLLNVEPGKATNRTVITFAGEPEAVIEASRLATAAKSAVVSVPEAVKSASKETISPRSANVVEIVAPTVAVIDAQNGLDVGEQVWPGQKVTDDFTQNRCAPHAATDQHVAETEIFRCENPGIGEEF